ncbi:MAG: tRNA pseudouridine(38-40) synthase TruA, partial [Clostridiales bacterium]|nr:tRNA pseudouridine(38-40) synthase TruA [Clostridiales bacterium]
MRYKITLSYDGTDFCGWQHQPNGNSIQDAVEAAGQKLFGQNISVVGSGRTDAGVHAIAQVAHFDADKVLPNKNVVGGLNAYLPRSVRVTSAYQAPDDFNARNSAKQKTYMYLMYVGESLPVLNDRALCLENEPDMQRMNICASEIVGRHDFSTFMAAGGGAKTFTRTVKDAHFERDGRFIKFFITADGFLYNMVRIITAQLLKAGRGVDVNISELIEKRDRSYAKELAPACGLYLYS